MVASAFSGCGMDDGPFEATRVDVVIPRDSATVIGIEDGELLIWNGDSLSPLVGLTEQGRLLWTLEMDVSRLENFSNCMLWEVSDVTLQKDADPIEMTFIGDWTYGAERGWMEIDRTDGSNEFCLSW